MNKSDKEFLGGILQIVSDAIYSGDTSMLDDAIQNLKEISSTKYPDAPEGATHIDLNDPSESKWMMLKGGLFYYYDSHKGWTYMDIVGRNIKLEEL